MADSSTNIAQIVNLIAGDCWSQCQLCSGIKNLSLVLKLRKWLTHMRAVFIYTLAISVPNSEPLYNPCSDSQSICGRLLRSMPATEWYRICPCHIKTDKIAFFYRRCSRKQAGDILLDRRYLHDWWTELDSICRRLLGLTSLFLVFVTGPPGHQNTLGPGLISGPAPLNGSGHGVIF